MIPSMIGVLLGLVILAIIQSARKGPPNIFDAAHKKNIVKFRKYMNDGKTDLNAGDYKGMTALMYAIVSFNDSQLVREIIDLGAQVNIADKMGNSALHYAVINNNSEIVKILLNKGILKDHKNSEGKTAQDIAKANSFEVADLLY